MPAPSSHPTQRTKDEFLNWNLPLGFLWGARRAFFPGARGFLTSHSPRPWHTQTPAPWGGLHGSARSLRRPGVPSPPWAVRSFSSRGGTQPYSGSCYSAWAAMPTSRASSPPRDRTQVSHIAGGFFTFWATRETPKLVCVLVTQSCLTVCDPMNNIAYRTPLSVGFSRRGCWSG